MQRNVLEYLEHTAAVCGGKAAFIDERETVTFDQLLHRARAMVPLMVPLFVSAFRRADELALAMEARCYRGGTGRTRMKVLKYARIDLMAFLTLTALIVCVVLVRGLI